jgi:hypothetical protein
VCKGDSYCAQNAAGEALCLPEPTTSQLCSAAVPFAKSLGLRCLAGTCQPQPTGVASCASNDDCGAAEPYCDSYAGNICQAGLEFASNSFDCQGFVKGEAVDAGVVQDTGAPDTGTPDTGAPDTGVDTGAADSGGD